MSLDERQETVLKTFTRENLLTMDLEDLVKLVGEAGPTAKLRGKGIVKRAEGSVRYDASANPGDFGETPEELQAHADRESTIQAFGEDHPTGSAPTTNKPVSSGTSS